MSGASRQRIPGALLLALGVLAAPVAIAGGDDGGVRSVFADGAGNRALALGGAYAAVADDASAALWNPGGLGELQRREFLATHTNLIGMGFSEQLAALAVPSWRWGTAAVTFRHFGVDGIEQRDPRNLLLDDDLSDSETELALAFGRRIGESWSVGGSVKLQRQSLAGYSGSGVGLDLGLLVRPLQALGGESRLARTLRLGLAVRNAVEPAIRLDQESVADPTGLRAGLAWEHPLGREVELLAAADLEKTRDMDARLHAGLELRLLSLLALRAGLSGGMLTAGTGVRWRDVGLDYLFEDNELGAVHRIGVGLAFGPTTAESRRAALREAEEALQSRLAEVFESRNRQRVADLFARAAAARRAGEWNEALEILATVKVLDPAHEGVAALEAVCLRQQGLELSERGDYAGAEVALGRALSLAPDDSLATRELERIRAESDLRAARSSEIRKLFDSALDAFATDELLVARVGFRRVLEQDPEDAEAISMLRRTEEAIRHRTLGLLDQSRVLIQAGQLAAADSILMRVRELDGAASGLDEVTGLLASARRVARREAEARRAAAAAAAAAASAPAPAPAAPSRPALTPEERREIDDLYRRGLAAMEKGRVDDAVRYWEFVWSADPGHENVAEYLKREYLTRGMESFASGRLHDAVEDWENALRIDPEDERAIGYLERAREQQSRIQKILGAQR